MNQGWAVAEGTEPKAPSPDGPGGDPIVVDPVVVGQLAAITDGDGRSVLSELLCAFLAAAPTRLDALDHAIVAGDLADVASQAHALTGSSGSFGATGMTALCRRLRVAAEGDDLEQSRSLVEELRVEYVKVRAVLGALIAPS